MENYKKMHKSAIVKGELAEQLNKQIAETYINEHNKYVNWLNVQLRDDSFKAEVKAMQDNINLSSTQKLMLGLKAKDTLEQRIRLKTANKTLLNAELVSFQQVEAKAYVWIIEDIEQKPEATYEELKAKFEEKALADFGKVVKVEEIS